MTLIHGGQLQQVAKQYQIPINDWLDLSTGIAPLSYPIPEIPLSLWQQLPQKSEGLIAAASSYYLGDDCSQKVLVTNGSQSIIKALPLLWRAHNPKTQQVYVPRRGYKEHGHAWQQENFPLSFYEHELPELNTLQENCVLVIINPNNPTGTLFNKAKLKQYQQKVTELNGLLVIDEAFIDVIPELATESVSMAAEVTCEHTLVLRSFGKFFGLAGIRLGFLITDDYWYQVFTQYLGPWQVNGPAQFIAEQALVDAQWHITQRRLLNELRVKQTQLLWQCWGDNIIDTLNATDLFITVSFKCQSSAASLYHKLCLQGVYVRLADERDTLRFGIVKVQDRERLVKALNRALTEVRFK